MILPEPYLDFSLARQLHGNGLREAIKEADLSSPARNRYAGDAAGVKDSRDAEPSADHSADHSVLGELENRKTLMDIGARQRQLIDDNLFNKTQD